MANIFRLHVFILSSYCKKYEIKNSDATTFWYKCSQSTALKSKPRKNENPAKQRDRQSMDRFNCSGLLRITVYPKSAIVKIYALHQFAHAPPINNAISDNIKAFIQSNINMLPKEIYARLVEQGLSIGIRQKQIHFWWSMYATEKFKRNENAFISSALWLEEHNQQIILQLDSPVHALAFSTGFSQILHKQNIEFVECGIDSTCIWTYLS